MECQYCKSTCTKAGMQKNGLQKYRCKSCYKYQQATYQYKACQQSIQNLFLKCLKAGNSLRGIQFITGISVNTQIRWIRKMGKTIRSPSIIRLNDTYELDELCTYVGNKKIRRWVISAISRTTGNIIDIKIGRRTSKNLKLVVDKILSFSPKAIYTDRLSAYKTLIPTEIHKVKHRGINKIERYHLSLRTHVKRLNRRTICYTKKEDILSYLVKIYVWS